MKHLLLYKEIFNEKSYFILMIVLSSYRRQSSPLEGSELDVIYVRWGWNPPPLLWMDVMQTLLTFLIGMFTVTQLSPYGRYLFHCSWSCTSSFESYSKLAFLSTLPKPCAYGVIEQDAEWRTRVASYIYKLQTKLPAVLRAFEKSWNPVLEYSHHYIQPER